jgi:CBS domain-containing protein
VGSDTTLDDAPRCMLQNGLTHLVVADDERPVGVVSALDVAGVLA